MTSPQSLCIFGGTFDPIHEGHIEVASLAHRTLDLDQVVFLPCRKSPHKLSQQTATADQRLDMCKLAINGHPWAQLNTHDLDSPAPSYSWKTAEHFRSLHPDAKLYWLLGTDQWNALHRWSRYQHLAELVDFIVCSRGHEKLSERSFTPTIIKMQHPASATKIRETISSNLPPEWLNEKVLEYIHLHKLYR